MPGQGKGRFRLRFSEPPEMTLGVRPLVLLEINHRQTAMCVHIR